MNRIRTLSMLQDFLDAEHAWRVKEVAALKLAVRSSDELQKGTLVRATVAILYAHWEGFVKAASEGYLYFLNDRRVHYGRAADFLIALGARGRLIDLERSRKASLHIATVGFFMRNMTDRIRLPVRRLIDTRSNLSSAVFENIVVSIGIAPSPYQSHYHLIDESLLRRRNRIAHGEHLDLEAKDCRNLADEVLDLMRHFKTDIEDAAANRRYLRLAAP